MNVVVLGASDKPDRYSYKAVKLLLEKGHNVFPVHQRIKSIDGLSVFSSIKDIQEPIDTITLYVASDISSHLIPEIMTTAPTRIIFNPGAENPLLEQTAQENGIKTINACTLVMLNTKQF